MTLIEGVALREVLDSRGEPTVEAEVYTESGAIGHGIAPSGASTGEHEAIERPPAEAIAAAREHAVPRLVGEVWAGDQRGVDAALRAADGTDNFSEIGANSAVAISMAAADAAAEVLGTPLYQHLGGSFRGRNYPVPLGNVIGGGEHAADATDIQEFLAVPVGAPSVSEAIFANAEIHRAVGDLFAERDVPCGKGDEGAWAPPVSDETAFDVAARAVERVADAVGFEIRLGIDVAATELWDGEHYVYSDETRTPDEQVEYMHELIDRWDLVYVEDPLEEDDFDGFVALTERAPSDTLICGDDLFVTNTERLVRGIEIEAGNSILIKPNQIGTLSATVDAIDLARERGFAPVISHRSGETEDTTIAHLAVAMNAPYIKTGAVGGERTAKLNELIRIADNA